MLGVFEEKRKVVGDKIIHVAGVRSLYYCEIRMSIRPLTFSLNEMESHWGVLSRGKMHSDFI